MASFTPKAAQRIAKQTKKSERSVQNTVRTGKGRRTPHIGKLVALTREDGIPARDERKPGKAEVTIYYLDDAEADEPKLVKGKDAAGEDEKLDAFNLSGDAVEADVFVMLVFGAGVWWVDFEDCSGGEIGEDEEDDGEEE